MPGGRGRRATGGLRTGLGRWIPQVRDDPAAGCRSPLRWVALALNLRPAVNGLGAVTPELRRRRTEATEVMVRSCGTQADLPSSADTAT